MRGLHHPCAAVLITSDKCYDNVEWTWGYRENDASGGGDPYSASKGAAELAIRSYVRSFFPDDGPVRIGIGRAGNVIGGGDWADDRIAPDCIRAWSRGCTFSLRNPLATRPWQHVLEPLSGYLSLAIALKGSAELHGEPFNFGPPAQQNHSVGELVDAMTEHWEQARWRARADVMHLWAVHLLAPSAAGLRNLAHHKGVVRRYDPLALVMAPLAFARRIAELGCKAVGIVPRSTMQAVDLTRVG